MSSTSRQTEGLETPLSFAALRVSLPQFGGFCFCSAADWDTCSRNQAETWSTLAVDESNRLWVHRDWVTSPVLQKYIFKYLKNCNEIYRVEKPHVTICKYKLYMEQRYRLNWETTCCNRQLFLKIKYILFTALHKRTNLWTTCTFPHDCNDTCYKCFSIVSYYQSFSRLWCTLYSLYVAVM